MGAIYIEEQDEDEAYEIWLARRDFNRGSKMDIAKEMRRAAASNLLEAARLIDTCKAFYLGQSVAIASNGNHDLYKIGMDALHEIVPVEHMSGSLSAILDSSERRNVRVLMLCFAAAMLLDSAEGS